MIVLPRGQAAISADWPDLVAELDRWGEAGQVAGLWWRDDDAVKPTPELASLLRLAGDVSLALAVIPAAAEPDLPGFLRATPQVAVLQHGWRHANHAALGTKKSEFPDGRSAATVASELAQGHARLAELFGPRALPVLVPPWNRFAAGFVPLLTEIGIVGLSSMASREAVPPPAGIVRMDVHVDLVAWKDGRRFVGAEVALSGLIAHLRARRLGSAEPDTPVGILTHHLVMDRATAGFLNRLITTVAEHDAARWAAAAELLAR